MLPTYFIGSHISGKHPTHQPGCMIHILINLRALISLYVSQIQSAVTSSYLTSSDILEVGELTESRHEANLATALYIILYTQQIINPLIFLYSEFVAK